jgi:cell wall-associated NlpC family hydrolase
MGEVVAIWHTHPDASRPGEPDKAGCQASWLPWIVAGPEHIWVLYPKAIGYLSREFVYGEEDCWQLCHDWWSWEGGVLFPWFERPPEGWWESEGVSPYLEQAERFGFRAEAWGQVDRASLARGDVLLMKVAGRRSNHAALYVGGGCIMHHMHGRLSCVELLDDRYQRLTTHLCRYHPCN